MGDPRGKVKALRRAMLKGEIPAPEKKPKVKKPLARKPAPRAIVRLVGTDLDGNKQVPIALMRIKGVGYNFARAVCTAAGIDHRRKLAELSDEETERIEQVIENPLAAGVPRWAVNRQRDPATGADLHVSGADLPIIWRTDIELQKRIHSWRGWRHELGLPVRGQHTRTSGRKGIKVGVVRKKVQPARKKEEEKKREKG